jgi:hypothetical protein
MYLSKYSANFWVYWNLKIHFDYDIFVASTSISSLKGGCSRFFLLFFVLLKLTGKNEIYIQCFKVAYVYFN